MWTRELLKRNAKEIFKRNYWTCVDCITISEEVQDEIPE